MNEKGGVLLVFSKAPVAGNVKKRLIPYLGETESARLYKSLLTRTLDSAAASDFSQIELHCYPTIDHPFFRDCESKYNLTLHQQHGHDLGEKMHNALSTALQKYTFAVIAGCDCPVLTTEILNKVRQRLLDGCRTVLGPCEDGGYCLVGTNTARKTLFEGIDWGQDTVLETTRDRLRSLGDGWYETETLWDVDRIEDYHRLQACEPSFHAEPA